MAPASGTAMGAGATRRSARRDRSTSSRRRLRPANRAGPRSGKHSRKKTVFIAAIESRRAALAPLAEREAQAEAQENGTREPGLHPGPEWAAGDELGERAAGESDTQIGRQGRHLEQQAEDEHLVARAATRRIDELWQEGEEEQQDLRIKKVGQNALPIDM